MQKISVRTLDRCCPVRRTEVVLSRFLSISTESLKIGFAFVPLVCCAMLYGPVWGAVAGGLADFIGAVLFPIGPYFPGFTLTNALIGLVFGLFCAAAHLVRLVSSPFVPRCSSTIWCSVCCSTLFGSRFCTARRFCSFCQCV